MIQYIQVNNYYDNIFGCHRSAKDPLQLGISLIASQQSRNMVVRELVDLELVVRGLAKQDLAIYLRRVGAFFAYQIGLFFVLLHNISIFLKYRHRLNGTARGSRIFSPGKLHQPGNLGGLVCLRLGLASSKRPELRLSHLAPALRIAPLRLGILILPWGQRSPRQLRRIPHISILMDTCRGWTPSLDQQAHSINHLIPMVSLNFPKMNMNMNYAYGINTVAIFYTFIYSLCIQNFPQIIIFFHIFLKVLGYFQFQLIKNC